MNNTVSQQHHHDTHYDTDDVAIFGFWTYILTDVCLFATIFATFIILQGGIFGGYPIGDVFNLSLVFTETMILLTSSFTCGLAMLALRNNNRDGIIRWIIVTLLLGLAFLCIEIYEFHHLYTEGYDWTKHGALSAFFVLVGTHGIHVAIGVGWALMLVFHFLKHGISKVTIRKFLIFSIFWHFLDIIWIFVFTTVYLMGVI